MKVSVIINNYNYEDYLEECINSVLNQTYKNFELIIVDDGSIDKSREIITQYCDNYPFIKKIFKENEGQGSAFNDGFKVATGDIVCFLDSDDYWYHNKLETIAKEHEVHDIVEHSSLITDLTCRYLPTKKNFHSRLKETGELLRFAETSAISFKKDLLDVFFPIPDECKICADTYVILAAAYFSDKISTVNQELSHYRLHDKNNWFNNPNADRKYLQKYIYLLNEFLIKNNLMPIPVGKYKYYLDIINLSWDNEKRYVIYGTGELGKLVYKYLTQNGISISYFVDSDIEKCNDKDIIHYTNINSRADWDYIIIGSSYVEEIQNVLLSINIQKEKVISFL